MGIQNPEGLRIHYRGETVLSQKSGKVEEIQAPDFQAFIDNLIQAGEDNHGVGIAAPQVGKSLRVFILAPKPGPRYPDSPALEPVAVINPRVLRVYGELKKDW